ncbi:MAG: Trk system potassium transporter TrkA [Rhodospirillaceae bacterium]|nr:Trk system potassium transporter TrkA [Rhodospirillaceae bacterium]|tara:strand:+ start:796 stop:2172 length:1377 start_codon:yes stop_codon:yes gene_type:complete
MKVIVCGAGQVGASIAKHLASENNDVTVIDIDPELIRRVHETIDVQTIVGHASQPDILEKSGANDAEMIISVTRQDEVNMVSCQVAHTIFNIPTKIARIRSQSYLSPQWQYLFSRDNMPIDVIISPEIEIARAVTNRLHVPGATDMMSFADDLVKVISLKVEKNCPIIDTPLRQLTELFPDLLLRVFAILRNDEVIIANADEQLLVDDEVFFAVESSQITRAMTAFGHEEKEARKLVIVGGGNIGLYLSSELIKESQNISLKLIEKSRSRAELVAESLNNIVVINGDSLEKEILMEANVSNAEAVIAVTNNDQVNILSSLLSKREGAGRVMALLNNSTYDTLMQSLGIDAVVNPRAITVSSILQHIRRGRIRAVHSIRDGSAEIIEAEALETSPLIGKTLKDISLPNGIIFGAIVRDKKVIIPRGDTSISIHDRVILFAKRGMIKRVEKLFAVRLDFF